KQYTLSFDIGICLLPLIVCGIYPEGRSPDKARIAEMIQSLQFSHPSSALSELRTYLAVFRDTRGCFLEAREVNFDVSECMVEFLECPVIAPGPLFPNREKRSRRLFKAREAEGRATINRSGYTASDEAILKDMGIRFE
ncbi:MAG: hypothetical protein AAB796_02620, partial [Patescibacteria group bacterium]